MEKDMEKHEHEGPQGGEGCCGGSQGAGPGRQKGMAMMEKMMGQGGPMAMMQKMMAGMGQAEGAAPMQQMMATCMAMCQEMLGAIRQTNALAVFATPELQHAFAEWLQALESKAEATLAEGEKDAAALAGALAISEESARYLLARLTARGKITLTGKART